VLSAVIATSRYYRYEKVMPLLPALMILSLGVVPAKKSCVDAPATTQTLRGLDVLSGPACALTEPMSFVARES
jgi:hypothetical protein